MQFDLFPMPEAPAVAPAKSLAGVTLIHGDCLVEMANIPSGSVDLILTDLPFGTTQCHWDTVIPFEPLWAHYKRIIKGNGAIVLFASQPFTSALIRSNIKMFKYELIWNKTTGTDFLNAKRRPIKAHENVCVFSKMSPTYNPQKTLRKNIRNRSGEKKPVNINNQTLGAYKWLDKGLENDRKFPISVLEFPSQAKECNNINRIHPTQKPVALLEYLIRTYTNEGETVLDSCAGSGSTGVACINTNRKFIGIEKDDKYFEIAVTRINNQPRS